jgi:hypothetical protein
MTASESLKGIDVRLSESIVHWSTGLLKAGKTANTHDLMGIASTGSQSESWAFPGSCNTRTGEIRLLLFS